MLRNLLVRSFSASHGDVGREGWERRLESQDGNLLGRKGEGGFGSHLGWCPFRLTFLPFRASLSPQAVLDSCRERRSLGGGQKVVRYTRLGLLSRHPCRVLRVQVGSFWYPEASERYILWYWKVWVSVVVGFMGVKRQFENSLFNFGWDFRSIHGRRVVLLSPGGLPQCPLPLHRRWACEIVSPNVEKEKENVTVVVFFGNYPVRLDLLNILFILENGVHICCFNSTEYVTQVSRKIFIPCWFLRKNVMRETF